MLQESDFKILKNEFKDVELWYDQIVDYKITTVNNDKHITIRYQNDVVVQFKNGKIHNDSDRPAKTSKFSQSWWRNGLRHRDNGPAIVCGDFKAYFIDGKEYTEDEFYQKTQQENNNSISKKLNKFGWSHLKFNWTDITDYTFENDKLYLKFKDGSKRYFYKGALHRTDGPAVIKANGESEYFLSGKFLYKENYVKELVKIFKSQYENELNWNSIKDISIDEYGTYITWENGENTGFINGKEFGKDIYLDFVKNKIIDKLELNPVWKEQNIRQYLIQSIEVEGNDVGIQYIDFKQWYRNGYNHNINGPTTIFSDNNKIWCSYGCIHRKDGPAIERASGDNDWFEFDHLMKDKYTEQEYHRKSNKYSLLYKIFKNLNIYIDTNNSFGPNRLRDYLQNLYWNIDTIEETEEHYILTEYNRNYNYWIRKSDLKFHREGGFAINCPIGTMLALNDKSMTMDSYISEASKFKIYKDIIKYVIHYRQIPLDGFETDKILKVINKEDIFPKELQSGVDFFKTWVFPNEKKNIINNIISQIKKEQQDLNNLVDKINNIYPTMLLDISIIDQISPVFNPKNNIDKEIASSHIKYKNGKEEFYHGDNLIWYKINNAKYWISNNGLHREDGPAVEYSNGDKLWYKNGKLHRLDGPAIIMSTGEKQWWIEGKEYSEKDFNEVTIASINTSSLAQEIEILREKILAVLQLPKQIIIPNETKQYWRDSVTYDTKYLELPNNHIKSEFEEALQIISVKQLEKLITSIITTKWPELDSPWLLKPIYYTISYQLEQQFPKLKDICHQLRIQAMSDIQNTLVKTCIDVLQDVPEELIQMEENACSPVRANLN